MALGPMYKKYGSFDSPDMNGMVAGQQAVAESLKGAMTGVQDLLKDTQDKYKQENTLNLASQLKTNLRKEGLGAAPLDTTAIQQKYGNLIDADALKATFNSEKTLMEEEAVNTASGLAKKTLLDTGDEVAAHKAMQDSLRGMNAKENFISRVTQTWQDNNATLVSDMKTKELRADQTLLTKFDEQLKVGGIATGRTAIAGILAEVPDDKKPAKEAMLLKRLGEKQTLTPEQDRIRKGNLVEYDSRTALQTTEYDDQISKLESQYATYEQASTIPDNVSKQLNAVTSNFGDDEMNAISDELGFMNSGDKRDFRLLREELSQDVSSRDAALIISQAFNREYDGGGWTGNNISPAEMGRAKVYARQLRDAMVNKRQIGAQLTTAKAQKAKYGLSRIAGKTKLDDDMHLTGQNRNVGNSDKSIRDYWKNRQTASPVKATGTGTTTETGPKKSAIQITKDALAAKVAENKKKTDGTPIVEPTVDNPGETPTDDTTVDQPDDWQNRTLWGAFKSDRAKKSAAKTANIKKLLSAAPTTEARVDALSQLPQVEQESQLKALEGKLGKSKASQIRRQLTERLSTEAANKTASMDETIRQLRAANNHALADQLEALR